MSNNFSFLQIETEEDFLFKYDLGYSSSWNLHMFCMQFLQMGVGSKKNIYIYYIHLYFCSFNFSIILHASLRATSKIKTTFLMFVIDFDIYI